MSVLPLKQIPFGSRSGFTIPQVNIGAMRLPGDTDEAVALIRHAIDNGMRYIDTSRGYGDSEIKLGKALKNGYREKVILSTKWSPWITKIEENDDASADCVVKRIEESMQRLDVAYLDYYQVWNIDNRKNYDLAVAKGGFVDGIRKAQKRGLVGHIGMTSHDSVENLLTYCDEMDWCEIMLLGYNIMHTVYAPVLDKAHKCGIGTIVMNPVGGGKFADNSAAFAPLVEQTDSRDLADLSIRYILGNPSVDTIISGISKISDVDSTVATAQKPPLTETQRTEVDTFIKNLTPQKTGFCTACGYCMPCPQEINIPKVMDAIFNYRHLGFTNDAKNYYKSIGNAWLPGKNASACIDCGECTPKCTQKLNIPQEMTFANTNLAS